MARDHIVDKAEWARGPWDSEPDREEWRSHGLPCLIVRAERGGNLCGYVGVPPGHPWHGKEWSEIGARVHGGLTYSERCWKDGPICHVPQPGEPDDVWWVGFDCAHAWDSCPGTEARMRKLGFGPIPNTAYRGIDYVRAEVEDLAKQAAEAARG